MTEKFLEYLRRHNKKVTFFTVGEIARNYPSLIQDISSEGHEIACHTDQHDPIEVLGPTKFADDLKRCVEALTNAGAKSVDGFRAPYFSLTPKTPWAHKVLNECGFRYSSSVLPSSSPLYGWPNFGEQPRIIEGVLELPMTLLRLASSAVPLGGGVYFRALPKVLLLLAARQMGRSRRDILGYFHPYDIDTEQEKFMHPNINDSRFFNFLMYYGRASVFDKLDKLFDSDFEIITYREYSQKILGSSICGQEDLSTNHLESKVATKSKH